ncbi:MAG: hypothetical protein INQ03_22770 [Candidatus Heimdallarchaeota archaeon]|nr:hypothetical protein [Candidatus Heimdallarchaeota archaeon]
MTSRIIKTQLLLIPFILLLVSSSYASLASEISEVEEIKGEVTINPEIKILFDGSEYRQAMDHFIPITFMTQGVDPALIKIDAVLSDGSSINVCSDTCADVDTGEGYYEFRVKYLDKSSTKILDEINPLYEEMSPLQFNPLYEGLKIYDSSNPEVFALTGDHQFLRSYPNQFFDIMVEKYNPEDPSPNITLKSVIVDFEVRFENVRIFATDDAGLEYYLCEPGSCGNAGSAFTFSFDPTKVFPGTPLDMIADKLAMITFEDVTSGNSASISATRAKEQFQRKSDTYRGAQGLAAPYIPGGSFQVDSFFDIDYRIDYASVSGHWGVNATFGPTPSIRGGFKPQINVVPGQTELCVIYNVELEEPVERCDTSFLRIGIVPHNGTPDWIWYDAGFEPEDLYPGLSTDDLNSRDISFKIFLKDDPDDVIIHPFLGDFQVDSFFDIAYQLDIPPATGPINGIYPSTIQFRGLNTKYLDKCSPLLVANLDDGTSVTIADSVCSDVAGDYGGDEGGIIKGILRGSRVVYNWDYRNTFPGITPRQLNEKVLSISMVDVNEAQGISPDESNKTQTFNVDSFFDISYESTVPKVRNFVKRIDKSTPLLANVVDPTINDDTIQIVAIYDHERVPVCIEGCAVEGKVRFDFVASQYFPDDSAVSLNRKLRSFIIFSTDNPDKEMLLPSPRWSDATGHFDFWVDQSPQYTRNGILALRFSIDDPSLELQDISITAKQSSNATGRGVCQFGKCFALPGFGGANINVDQLIGDWTFDDAHTLDPSFRVSLRSDPDTFTEEPFLSFGDNLDIFDKPLQLVWGVKSGYYEGTVATGGVMLDNEAIYEFQAGSTISFVFSKEKRFSSCYFRGEVYTTCSTTHLMPLSLDEEAAPTDPLCDTTCTSELSRTEVLIDGRPTDIDLNRIFNSFFLPSAVISGTGSERRFSRLLEEEGIYGNSLDDRLERIYGNIQFIRQMDGYVRIVFLLNNEVLRRVDVLPDGRILRQQYMQLDGSSQTGLTIESSRFIQSDESSDTIHAIQNGKVRLNLRIGPIVFKNQGTADDIKIKIITRDGVRDPPYSRNTSDFSKVGKFAIIFDFSDTPVKDQVNKAREVLNGMNISIEYLSLNTTISLSGLEFTSRVVDLEPGTIDSSRPDLYLIYQEMSFIFEQSFFPDMDGITLELVEELGSDVFVVPPDRIETRSITWTPWNVKPGTYFMRIMHPNTDPAVSPLFTIVGEDSIYVDINQEFTISVGNTLELSWSPSDRANDDSKVDLSLLDSNGRIIELVSGVANTGKSSVSIPILTINGENFGKYRVRVSISGMQDIFGDSKEFSVRYENTTSIVSTTTEGVTDDPVSPDLPVPGFELGFMMIILFSFIVYRRRYI